jgi:hypothetical protein
VKALVPILLSCAALLTIAPPALAAPGHGAVLTGAHGTLARVGIGGFRGRGFGSRNRGFGSRTRSRGRGRSIFRSIIRALALGYLLHLLFTTPGGLLVLVLMIGAVLLLMSRFRRRRRLVRW